MTEEIENKVEADGGEVDVNEIALSLKYAFRLYVHSIVTLLVLVIAISVSIGMNAVLFLVLLALQAGYCLFKLKSCTEKLEKAEAKVLLGEYGKPFNKIAALLFTLIVGMVGIFGLIDNMFMSWSHYPSNENIEGVYKSLTDYAELHDGAYPPAEGWYEELFPEGKLKEYGIREMYAMVLNPAALELGDAMPDDMVLGVAMYDDKWGEVGGYDEMVGRVGRTICCMMGDGSEKVVKTSRAKYLRWGLEELPEPDHNDMAVYGFAVIAAVGGVYIVWRNRRSILISIPLMLVVGAVGAAAGGFLGSAAEGIYGLQIVREGIYDNFHPAGIVFGCVVGALFVLQMAGLKYRSEYKHIEAWSTYYGAITGLICSTLLHAFLMVYHKEMTLMPMLAGVPFGVWAGLMPGWITGVVLDMVCRRRE